MEIINEMKIAQNRHLESCKGATIPCWGVPGLTTLSGCILLSSDPLRAESEDGSGLAFETVSE